MTGAVNKLLMSACVACHDLEPCRYSCIDTAMFAMQSSMLDSTSTLILGKQV